MNKILLLINALQTNHSAIAEAEDLDRLLTALNIERELNERRTRNWNLEQKAAEETEINHGRH